MTSVLAWGLDTITHISTTNTVAIPHWATTAPPKSNGAPHLLPLRPNEPLHQNGSRPDWLSECQVTHVAMESTGVYWKPIVRHEALFDREGMKGPLLRAVAAAC